MDIFINSVLFGLVYIFFFFYFVLVVVGGVHIWIFEGSQVEIHCAYLCKPSVDNFVDKCG